MLTVKPPCEERRRLIAAPDTGEFQVLSNCGLISEGLDVPTVTAAILLRPTKSLALHFQQVGRALRLAPNAARTCTSALRGARAIARAQSLRARTPWSFASSRQAKRTIGTGLSATWLSKISRTAALSRVAALRVMKTPNAQARPA
jgi:Helicase conserved C-terminal domain